MNNPTANNSTLPPLVIEREIPHPPEKIWRALTQGALIKEWLMENDFQPVVGHKFNFRAVPVPNWDGVINSEVLAVEPNKRLSYSWSSMGMNWVVAWTLTPTKNGTLLHFEQSGFLPGQERAYKGANYGWNKFIRGLEKVVAGLK
jgi:uncharacterized protein YndB with AHSA1/START domain